ncbi:MAG: sugar phosphate nucleotidyltransferase, partial [Verrucomicrobiia bacterium]
MEKKVIAVIMGGGRGSRLHPLTKERCKPAVPLAGKYRLVDIPISNCLNSGVNKIYLLTQFNTASLHRHIQETYRFDPFGGGTVDILSAEQTEAGDSWYQGTADAVRQNLHHFTSADYDYVLILSGDQLYRMDFQKILQQHIESEADVTVSAIPFPVSQLEGLGLMRVKDNLEISEFVEK